MKSKSNANMHFIEKLQKLEIKVYCWLENFLKVYMKCLINLIKF